VTPAEPADAAAAASSAGPCSEGKSLYVSPQGRAENDGSLERPLDLVTALSGKGPARPCDTIWLRGGTYKGTFTSSLNGADGSPIVVRRFPGERATIDSAPSAGAGLYATGSWTWFWGFEVTNSDPQRYSKESGPWPSDLRRGTGVASRGSQIKFINLVVHDMARGFEVSEAALNNEFYGNLIYSNGWGTPQGSSGGSGIETRNQIGFRRLADNIVFNQFSNGVLIFGKNVDNVTLEGNVVFNSGSISQKGINESRNVLIGGTDVVANNIVVKDNTTYNGQTNLGYGAGCASGTIEGNYFAGPLVLVKCSGVIRGNTLYEPSSGGFGALPTQYPENTYEVARPSGITVRIRPNQYEPGRANIVVLNWSQASEAKVDVSGIGLKNGDRYEVRDAQNYFGKPLASATYDGLPIAVPLTSTAVAQPVGAVPVAPKPTAPEFGVFVVQKVEPQPGS
jgi:hypothetical protein